MLKIVTDTYQLHKKVHPIPLKESFATAQNMLLWLLQNQSNRSARTIGLASNQLGLKGRVISVRRGHKWHMMINPSIYSTSEETAEGMEGCLSVDGLYKIERSTSVTVEYYDIKQKALMRTRLDELDARVVQHEIDHLDGKLISDNYRGVK